MSFPLYRYLVLTSLLLTGFAGCGEDSPVAPPVITPGDGEPIIYSKHIQPIFNTSCATSGCHLNGDRGGGLALDSWERVLEGSHFYGTEVIPYASAKSHLFQHVNTDSLLGPIAFPHMPLGRDPLPIEQIRTIRRWIDSGAKNDAGEVALSDPSRPRLFVTAQGEDKVSVIDLATQRLMRFIDVGEEKSGDPESPHNILFSPNREHFYVNLIAAGLVEKYDTRTFRKLGSVRVGRSPAQIAVTRDGSTLYVSNFDISLTQRFIVRVNTATMSHKDTIPEVGNAPHGVALSFDESTLYTTNALGDDISVVDLATLEVVRRIPASPGSPLPPTMQALIEPYQGEISQDGKFFWFTCRKSGEVRVLDLDARRVVDSIKVGASPLIPAFTPDGNEFWVPNKGSDNLSIINTSTRSVVATINALRKQPHAVAFTADGRTAFISCENLTGAGHHHAISGTSIPGLIYVVDVASRKILQEIEVGSFAAGLIVGGP